MRLEGRSRPTASTAQESKSMLSVSRTRPAECAIHYILPARLVPRLRVTSPQLPSFWQRTAAAQERDVCLPRLLQNNSPVRSSTSDA
jgi:hypothetical protein